MKQQRGVELARRQPSGESPAGKRRPKRPWDRGDARGRTRSGTIDGRSWRERIALARVLGAFLPQDHRAAKRLHLHLYHARLPVAARAMGGLDAFADAVVTDNVPEAITIYEAEGLDARIGDWI